MGFFAQKSQVSIRAPITKNAQKVVTNLVIHSPSQVEVSPQFGVATNYSASNKNHTNFGLTAEHAMMRTEPIETLNL